jgi:DNA-binding MarR family transcriptional regulator
VCGQGNWARFVTKDFMHPNKCIYIYLVMEHPPTPKLPCLCGNFRRTSRALTQLYETALRPVGLRATQCTLLQVLMLAGEVTQSRLGEMLVMDSTTLSRTLRIMAREGWIAERRGKDRRERWLGLAKGGKAQFKHALPAWEKVQSRLRRRLGEQAWKHLLEITHQVTDLVAMQGDSL